MVRKQTPVIKEEADTAKALHQVPNTKRIEQLKTKADNLKNQADELIEKARGNEKSPFYQEAQEKLDMAAECLNIASELRMGVRRISKREESKKK